MGAGIEVVIVAASLYSALAATPPDNKSGLAMQVQVVERGTNDGELAPFLRERLLATWPNSDSLVGRSLSIRVVALSPEHFEVAVVDNGEVWAERSFAVNNGEPVAVRLAVWLFVRSTLNRLLAEKTVIHNEPGTGLADASASSDPAASASTSIATTPGQPEATNETRSGDVDATVSTESSASAGSSASPSSSREPPKSGLGAPVSTALLATSSVAPGAMSFFGASVAADWSWRKDGVAWGELGYAYGEAGHELVLHQALATIAVGVRPSWLSALELGLSADVALELAKSGAHSRWVGGADVGPTGRWRTPLGVGRSLLFRVGWMWSLVRQRYLLAHGTRSDAPWAAALAVGVAWP